MILEPRHIQSVASVQWMCVHDSTEDRDNITHLVLPLARHLGARENNSQVPPQRILLDLLPNEVTDAVGYTEQELRARSDAVRVERPRVGIDIPHVSAISGYDAFGFRGLGQILGRAESTRALLIKLSARCHSIDGHEDGHFRFHDLSNDTIKVWATLRIISARRYSYVRNIISSRHVDETETSTYNA